MTDKNYLVPETIFVNTDMADSELGAALRRMMEHIKPGEWANVTMGDCNPETQAMAPWEHLGTISVNEPG